MKKLFVISLLLIGAEEFNIVNAQVIIGPQYRRGYRRVYRQRPVQPMQQLPKFEPSVNIAVGYGFPNLDKLEFPQLYNYYRGTFSQNGPITGSIDYQFSRNMSIGAMVTHGKVYVPYYDYNNIQALKGSLDNWSFMLNIMRYMPVYNTKVTPYFRTAIGINSWEENFTDTQGNKVNMSLNPGDLAYQIGLGAKFSLSKNAGLLLEAGYGKYILSGGLAVKF